MGNGELQSDYNFFSFSNLQIFYNLKRKLFEFKME